MNKTALSQLGSFTGTEQYHRYSPLFPNLVLTDGVKFFAENADCFWLLDVIGSFQPDAQRDESLQGLQFWSLRPWPKAEKHPVGTVGHMMQAVGKLPAAKLDIPTKGGIIERMTPEETDHFAASVVCERDTGDAALVQDIIHTDFPFDAVPEPRIWVAPQYREGQPPLLVAMLPSEY